MTTLTLRNYLDTKRTTSADWNITGLGNGPSGWLGKYAIPEDEYEAFLMLAHEHIFTKNRACSLLEKHLAQSPILIDLDFRYPAGGPLRRRFTNEHLRRFVAAYADAFARFFQPPKEVTEDGEITKSLQFFVMLKPAAEADSAHESHKDGVHIVCPSVTTRPEIQYAIRGWLLQNNVIENIFGDTGMTNPPQDCLDISVVARNNWFLYGACKPDKAWYKLESVYSASIPDSVLEEGKMPATILTSDHLEEDPVDGWTQMDLLKLLSIRHGHHKETPLTLRTEHTDTEVEWLQLLQRYGKGQNFARNAKSPALFAKSAAATAAVPDLQLQEPTAVVQQQPATAEEMVQLTGISVRSGYTADDIALAYRLTRECLHPERRCGEYQDWVNLGMCLKNISNTEESFRVWAEMTRRTGHAHKKSKYPEQQLRDKWTIFPAETTAVQSGRKPLMMGSLHNWAKEDSPETYKTIIASSNRDWALLNNSGSHVSVAELVVRMYRHEFRCTPPKKGANANSMDWFQFNGHTWRNMKTWMRIRERLSNEVRNQYLEAEKLVIDRIIRTSNEDERQRLEAQNKNLRKVEGSLMQSGFKDSVMKELTEKFYDEDFLQFMNIDPTTVGFSNGVLELRHIGSDGNYHVHFRPGRPDDCISFQMGRSSVGMESIPYVPYDPAKPELEHTEIFDFLRKIYPNPILFDYMLTLLASCLEGINREQKFYIMTGGGSNGKSKLIDLMNKTFGEYQETVGTTVITRKRPDSGAANPDLIVIKCKRFISMSEPDPGEKINTSSMKLMSGEDILKARGLFADQDAFVVMGKMFMLCNDMPPVDDTSNGTWRRLRVIPHVSTFKDLDEPIDPSRYIFHKDIMLEEKIKRWRPFFASILVWYYENKYLREGLKEPDVVMVASRKYKEDNDAFAAFQQDCLVREDGAEVRINDILSRYKDWLRFNPGKKVLQKKDILHKMEEIYGKSIDDAGKIFAGVRIAEEEEGSMISNN